MFCITNTSLNDFDITKKNINSSLVNCIFEINQEINRLNSQYSAELIELISVLKSNQKDIIFPDVEGQVIGKYLHSKGYTKQDIDILISCIIKSFD